MEGAWYAAKVENMILSYVKSADWWTAYPTTTVNAFAAEHNRQDRVQKTLDVLLAVAKG